MRRFFALLCCLCLSSCAIASDNTAPETSALQDNTEAFAPELSAYFAYDWLGEYADYSDLNGLFSLEADWFFADIDNDSTYELLNCLQFNFPQGTQIMKIYDYYDGRVQCLGEVKGGALTQKYQSVYEKDLAPEWLSGMPVAMYRKNDGDEIKYVTYTIHQGGRALEYDAYAFIIKDGNVSATNLGRIAEYTFDSENTSVTDGWTYLGKSESDISDLEAFFTDTFDGYKPYNPTGSVLHTSLDCMTWMQSASEDNMKTAYDEAIADAQARTKTVCER